MDSKGAHPSGCFAPARFDIRSTICNDSRNHAWAPSPLCSSKTPVLQVWDSEKVIIIPDHYIFTADERANRNVDMMRWALSGVVQLAAVLEVAGTGTQ